MPPAPAPELLDRLSSCIVVVRVVDALEAMSEPPDFAVAHVNRAALADLKLPAIPFGRLSDDVLAQTTTFLDLCREAFAVSHTVQRTVEQRAFHAQRDDRHVVVSWARPSATKGVLLDAYRATEGRFRALADAMPHLIWTARVDGTVDYYNERSREYAGLERTTAGYDWAPLLHPNDVAHTVAAWRDAVASRTSYDVEHRVQMRDGTYRWHVSRASLHDDVQGKGERWCGSATDIDDQKKAQQALSLAVATRDRVISVMLAELRNPLALVELALPALSETLALVPGASEREHAKIHVERIAAASAKMGQIFGELLDTIHLQSGTPLTLRRRPCDLVAIVVDTVAELRAPDVPDRFVLAPMPERAVGMWDAIRLERVIKVLLENALHHSRGAVLVAVTTTSATAVFTVVDYGDGIPPHVAEHVFEWFAGDALASGESRGSGLGLAGAKRLVELHGGTLTMETARGVGTTLSLALPLHERP